MTPPQKTAHRAAESRAAAGAASRVAESRAAAVQASSMRVSSPQDSAEREAEHTAKKIMRMPAAESVSVAPIVPIARGPALRVPLVQRVAEGQPNIAANVQADIRNSMSSGSPLPLSVRRFMEPRFQANFSDVKIHSGEKAAKLNRQLNARAFTVGNHIFFGKGQLKPETQDGKELIAHELTHTIQQGAAVQQGAPVQRSEDAPAVTQHSSEHVQRLGLDDALSYFAKEAVNIPGFRMFTIVLGVNPIDMSRVDRSAANILRAVVEFLPGGAQITQALDNYGIFDRVGAWVEQQLASLGMVGSAIKQAISQFLDTLHWSDIFDLGGVWNRARRIFSEPIDRLISFAKGLFDAILQFIKDAILRPLAGLAAQAPGWDLLTAVLGRNPITGDDVPRNAETLIGGFMKLIHEEEVWENIKKGRAIDRAFAWFQTALNGAMGFVRELPGLFLEALKSLGIADLVLLPMAFAKVGRVFGSFFVRFVSWAGTTVLKLLEIVIDAVSPGAMEYLRKTGAALLSILKNPLPFMGNLVKAAKAGFNNFGNNFLTHLKAGLINWLTGSLPGVYIPKSFALGEIVKFVFSVLGVSWQNIRGKLVKVVGEPVVKAMEVGFDIVVTLVTQGPAAAWEKIKEQLANLKDMAISAITDFVVDLVVKKAIPKLIAMFIPGAGFIGALMSIYDTVMTFVQQLTKIIEVVKGFVDSIVAIAGGAIGAAAARVESILAGLLSLAISFLAGFVGLGKVADKVMGVIEKVRSYIDKALDALINWIVTMAKKLFAKVFGKDKKDERTDAQKQKDLDDAVSEAEALMAKEDDSESVREGLNGIKGKYKLTKIELVRDSEDAKQETDHVLAEINPRKPTKKKNFVKGMDEVKVPFEAKDYNRTEYRRQLAMAQRTIWGMLVHDWKSNRDLFKERGRAPSSARLQREFRDEKEESWIQKRVAKLRREAALEQPPRTLSWQEAVTQAEEEWKKQAALHPLDQVAGGGPQPTSIGDGAINSSIGSTWSKHVGGVDKAVKKISAKNRKIWHMNVTILLDGSAL